MKTVALGGKKAAGRVALVDDEDWPLVSDYRWHIFEPTSRSGQKAGGPYAVASVYGAGARRASLLMHTLITGWPRTDHIDHDGLNNQRYNLRPATHAQNMHNRLPNVSRTSRYKGVAQTPQRARWRARIAIDGKRHHLGYFGSEEEAALAYNAAALELHGEYACLNQIESSSQIHPAES